MKTVNLRNGRCPANCQITASRSCICGGHCFCSARTIAGLLPEADKAKRAVVILRMHGRSRIGSTFIQILERYAANVQKSGGKIILSGVTSRVWDQLARTETFETIPESDVFLAGNVLGASTRQALEAAQSWLLHDDIQKSK